jgi:hypothetical protein
VVTLTLMVAASVITPENDPGPYAAVEALVSEGLAAFRHDPEYVCRMAEAAASLRKRKTSRRAAA